MRTSRTYQAALAITALLLAAACKAPDQEALTLGVWNVQALFDGVEAGEEYREYSAASGWSGEKYAARLTALSQALAPDAPDILALVELENPGVLKALAAALGGKAGYRWTAFAGKPGGGPGLGLLSRFPLTLTRAHSVYVRGETIPRPILEVRLDAAGEPLAIFVCHWKSKVGGTDETEGLRRSSAGVIRRRFQELRREAPGLPLLVLGDLNENYDEFSRRGGAAACALLPDDPGAAALSDPGGEGGQADFLVLSGEKPPRARFFPPEAAVFYSPWAMDAPPGAGSYVYKGAWETVDHVLLSEAFFDGAGWEFESFQVLNREPFVTPKGFPDAYKPWTGLGLSDHLPLLLRLKRAPVPEPS